MKSHIAIRKLATSLIVLAAAPFTFAADPAPDAAAMDKARMDAAVQFAETVLKYARDVYGEKHTPLFCDALDVDTMKASEMTYLSRLKLKLIGICFLDAPQFITAPVYGSKSALLT